MFVAALAQSVGKITHANKKKTVTMAHLKSVLNQSDSFEFLEGCFPNVLDF